MPSDLLIGRAAEAWLRGAAPVGADYSVLLADMRALSVRQPWAFAIAEGFKPDENRTFKTGYCGPIAIHAGLKVDKRACLARHSRPAADRLQESVGRGGSWQARTHVPGPVAWALRPSLARGAVIAVAWLAGCHEAKTLGCCAPWGEPGPGIWHWEITHVRALASPVTATGRLGLWRLSPAQRGMVFAQVGEANDGH